MAAPGTMPQPVSAFHINVQIYSKIVEYFNNKTFWTVYCNKAKMELAMVRDHQNRRPGADRYWLGPTKFWTLSARWADRNLAKLQRCLTIHLYIFLSRIDLSMQRLPLPRHWNALKRITYLSTSFRPALSLSPPPSFLSTVYKCQPIKHANNIWLFLLVKFRLEGSVISFGLVTFWG